MPVCAGMPESRNFTSKPMNPTYKMRLASKADRTQITALVREAIAQEKKCQDPAHVQADFINEYVEKIIAMGNMLVVENETMELEMIGEIHDYMYYGFSDYCPKELSFRTKIKSINGNDEKERVTWLYDEIQNKYANVFRVEMTTPVSQSSTVEYFRSMGLTVEGSYLGRLKNFSPAGNPVVPLSWINPAFN